MIVPLGAMRSKISGHVHNTMHPRDSTATRRPATSSRAGTSNLSVLIEVAYSP